MDKRSLLDGIENLGEDLQEALFQFTEMKTMIAELVERNANLEMENKHLRDHLENIQKASTQDLTKQELSQSRMNLEKLYEDGFHVCNLMYGSWRNHDEECAFCLDVIYGERKEMKK